MGANSIIDPFTYYFSYLFEEMGICDVELIQLVPTWRNISSGNEGFSKRIYRLLIDVKLMKDTSRLKS